MCLRAARVVQAPIALLLSGSRSFLRGPGVEDGGIRPTGVALMDEALFEDRGYEVVRLDATRAAAMPHGDFAALVLDPLQPLGVEVDEFALQGAEAAMARAKAREVAARAYSAWGDGSVRPVQPGAVELVKRHELEIAGEVLPPTPREWRRAKYAAEHATAESSAAPLGEQRPDDDAAASQGSARHTAPPPAGSVSAEAWLEKPEAQDDGGVSSDSEGIDTALSDDSCSSSDEELLEAAAELRDDPPSPAQTSAVRPASSDGAPILEAGVRRRRPPRGVGNSFTLPAGLVVVKSKSSTGS